MTKWRTHPVAMVDDAWISGIDGKAVVGHKLLYFNITKEIGSISIDRDTPGQITRRLPLNWTFA